MLGMLKRNTSINVMKVLWACDDLDIPLQRNEIGGKRCGNYAPQFRALNTNRLVSPIKHI